MEVEAPASGVLEFVAASGGRRAAGRRLHRLDRRRGRAFDSADLAKADAPTRCGQSFSPVRRGASKSRSASAPPERLRPRARARRARRPAARRLARERGVRLETRCAAPDRTAACSGATSRRRRRRRLARRAATVHRAVAADGARARRSCSCTASAPTSTAGGRCIGLLPRRVRRWRSTCPATALSPLGEDASFEALVEAARAALAEEGIERRASRRPFARRRGRRRARA